MASCPICGESVTEDAPLCYKCGSAFVWPRVLPKLDHAKRLRLACYLLPIASIVAVLGGIYSYTERHSGPGGSWPPALHVLIPLCAVAWFSSIVFYIRRRTEYSVWKELGEGTEPDRQPLAVPNRLMLS